MLIRELEYKTLLDRATIRFYEKEGLITPERKENGYRTYSEADVDTLLKVKLLRQLGISLEKIKALQQGCEDFSAALAEQIASLESQIDHAESARKVCIQIRDDATSYETLDASYYLKLLEQPALVDRRWTPQPVPEFHRKPVTHPWKRYFARNIDFVVFTIVTEFLIVVIFRIRPFYDILNFLNIFWIRYLLWIPVEGLLIHYFGTTPGKWLFGIHIESVDGGPLPLSNAMHRTWDILRYGYGFNVPFYSFWRFYRSYRDYKDYGYAQWDYDQGAEYQFSYYSTERKVAMGLAIALCIGMFCTTLSDSRCPVHRGEELTVAQFAQNYNLILEDAAGEGSFTDDMYLKEDGTWRTWHPANNVVYINIHSKAVIIHENGSWEEGYNDFDYQLENGVIRSISFEQTWEEIFMFSPMNGRVEYAVASIAGAQDWFNLISYYDFQQELSNQFKKEEGSFIYENLEIRWSTDSVNCSFSDGEFYRSNENAVSSVSLEFEIIIHPSE